MERLTAELAGLTDEIKGLRGDVQAEQETRERQVSLTRLAVVVAIVLAVVGAAVNGALILKVWQQQDQIQAAQQERAVTDCLRGNGSRAVIVEAFHLLVSSARLSDDPKVRVDQEERIAGFLGELNRRLGPRDCSADAVAATSTTVVG